MAWLPKILENYGISPGGAGVTFVLLCLTSIPAVLIFFKVILPHYRGWLIELMALLVGMSIFCVAEVDGFLGQFVVGYLVDVFGTFTSGGLFLNGVSAPILWLMFLYQHKSS